MSQSDNFDAIVAQKRLELTKEVASLSEIVPKNEKKILREPAVNQLLIQLVTAETSIEVNQRIRYECRL